MVNIDELERKLNSTEIELQKLAKAFLKFIEIREAPHSSNASLKASSDNLASLASALEKNATAMRDCVSSLNDAAKALNQQETTDVTSTKANLQTEFFDAKDKIDSISRAADILPKRVYDAVRASSDGTNVLLKSASRRQWFLSIMALIILGILLYDFYLDHGIPGIPSVNAELETTRTETDLAGQFLSGPVSQQDYVEAARLYRMAAEEGNANAQNNLGALYLVGRGVNQDFNEAERWFRRAAEQGLAQAQHNLGSLYVSGEGVPQDGREAVRWWLLAAEAGYPDSLYNLGVAYHDGFGVEIDLATAADWYLVAAEQGHGEAQLRLGMMLLQGEGVEQDNIEAYKWLTLASEAFTVAEEGLKNAALDARSEAEAGVSAEEIAAAQALAESWTAK